MSKYDGHTPGPWVWMDEKHDKHDGYGPVLDFEVSNLQGETHSGRLFPHHLQAGDDWILRGVWQTNDDATVAVSPANARLIADAPTLLAQRDEAVALLRLVKKWRDAPDSACETDLQCWGPEDWGDDIDAFLSRLDSKEFGDAGD